MNTIMEVSAVTGIGMIQIRNLISKGEIDAVQIAPGIDGVRIPDKEVQELINAVKAANN